MAQLSMEDLIKVLEDADPIQLAKFARELEHGPKTKKNHVPHCGPVKQYTTVTKEVTCLMCNSKTTYKHKLEKGEQLSVIDGTGFGRTITSTGKEGDITIASCVSRCNCCECVARTWEHETLIINFMKLLNSCSFKEVLDYTKE